jgi:hypothetical protein
LIFRTARWQSILRSALKLSIDNDHFEISKTIFDKFSGRKKTFFTPEPYFETYFTRYLAISSYLANRTETRNTKERIHREKQIRNLNVYKNFISYILTEKNSSSAEAPAKPSIDDEDLDCPVCFEFMCKPRDIFACHNGHLLCSVCLACPRITSCPICRDDFNARKPQRATEAEEKANNMNSTAA